MSHFIHSGSTWRVTDTAALDIRDALPKGNYVVKLDPTSGFYLEEVDTFALPQKIYGSPIRDADRILNTFMHRSGSTGVMLSGEKGSGKTMLARMLSVEAAGRYDMPTIIINTPYTGDSFSKFIQDIDCDCIILFDEFEKIYDSDDQQLILTLLDGVFTQKKLFVFTCNDKWRIDQHMRNRPGRIYYMFDFTGLTPEFVREYCEDTLVNKAEIESIVRLITIFPKFNFDMLQAIVEEMNRYGENVRTVMKYINARPEYVDHENYLFKVYAKGKQVPAAALYRDTFSGNPVLNEFTVTMQTAVAKKIGASIAKAKSDIEQNVDIDSLWEITDGAGSDDRYTHFRFTPNNIEKIDAENGTYTYKDLYGFTLVLEQKKTKTYDEFYGAL